MQYTLNKEEYREYQTLKQNCDKLYDFIIETHDGYTIRTVSVRTKDAVLKELTDSITQLSKDNKDLKESISEFKRLSYRQQKKRLKSCAFTYNKLYI